MAVFQFTCLFTASNNTLLVLYFFIYFLVLSRVLSFVSRKNEGKLVQCCWWLSEAQTTVSKSSATNWKCSWPESQIKTINAEWKDFLPQVSNITITEKIKHDLQAKGINRKKTCKLYNFINITKLMFVAWEQRI